MANCLVTGDCGYIGSHLVKRLKEEGHNVYGWDIKNGKDIRRLVDYSFWDQPFDFIFHLAAKPRVQESVLNPSSTLSNNVQGTSAVLEFAHKTGVKKVIFSSSSAIYGNGEGPINPYGLHKLMSEMECKFYSEHFNLSTVCLRYFNVYSEDQAVDGPYCTVIANWMDKIRKGEDPIIYGDGSIKRDFIYIDDIVEANLIAMNYDQTKSLTTDIGTGQSHSLNEIKEYILSVGNVQFKHEPKKECDPLETRATLAPYSIFPWKPKVSFSKGLKKCFK